MDYSRRNFLKGISLTAFAVAAALAAKGGVTPRQIAASDVRAELVRRGVRL